MTMIEEEPRTHISAVDLFGEKNVQVIAEPCPDCGKVHADLLTFVKYINYVASLAAINFN